MTLSDKTKDTSLQISGFLMDIAKLVVAGLILDALHKIGSFVLRRVSYPFTILLFDCFRALSAASFFTMVLYPRLKESRLSFLFPVVRFYARGFLRVVWVSLSPKGVGILSRIFQHNLRGREYAMLVATRSSKALADLFSADESDLTWMSSFIFSLMYKAASKSVVEGDSRLENTLREIREDLLAEIGPLKGT